jgi:hypothetical protein
MMTNWLKAAMVAAWLFLASHGVAAAGIIHPIGEASTDGFSQGIAASEAPRGWEFTVNCGRAGRPAWRQRRDRQHADHPVTLG